MMFGMVFIWLLILGLGGIVLSQFFPRARQTHRRDSEAASAAAILARRYAQGELTREEYELMRQDLFGPRND